MNWCILDSLTIFFFSVDCVRWAAEVQCEFPTCVPANQRVDIPNFCLHSGHFDCPPSYDTARHHCLHTCLYANWLGDASGNVSVLFCTFVLQLYCVYVTNCIA